MSKKLTFEINGVTKTLREWCEEYNQPFQRVYMRMKRGNISLEEALDAKLNAHTEHCKLSSKDRHIIMDGRTQTLRAWCIELNLTYNAVLKRILRGWNEIEALKAGTDKRIFDHDKIVKKRSEEMVGKVFNRLTVLRTAGVDTYENRLWTCRCECGNDTVVKTASLVSESTKSCGCLNQENLARGNVTHGLSDNPTYVCWLNMRNRCNNPDAISYQNYGGRGITYDPSWEQFENFHNDMGLAPEGKTIERIDNNGNYCKENCTWAIREVQSRNKRTNRYMTINGVTKVLKDWCDEYGIHQASVERRMRDQGMTIEEAITRPKKR